MNLHNVNTSDLSDDEFAERLETFIPVEQLGEFGFDDNIVKGFVEFKIMPDLFVFDREPEQRYVRKDDIRQTINMLLLNAVVIYRMVAERQQKLADFNKLVAENAVELSPEDLDEIAQGKMLDVFARKGVDASSL